MIDLEFAGLLLTLLLMLAIPYGALKTQRLAGEIQAISAATDSHRQAVSRWPGAGVVGTLISFALLLLAYGIYAADQPQTLPQLGVSMVRDHLHDIMPAAVLTEFVILSAGWILFGLLTGLDRRHLFRSLNFVVQGVMFTAVVIVMSVGIWRAVYLDWASLGIALLVLLIFTYVIIVIDATPEKRQARLEYLRRKGHSSVVFGRYRPERLNDPKERWRVAPKLLLLYFYVYLLLSLIAAGITGLIISARGGGVPTLEQIIRWDIIVSAVIFLLSCYVFRKEILDRIPRPQSLLPAIDFTLVISALAITVTGLPDGGIRLGQVPPWLAAIVPPLLVAGYLFLTQLYPLRTKASRWRRTVLIAILAGILVGPAKELLNAAFAPLDQLLF